MTVFIILALWLLVGYVTHKITRYSWEASWYESFKEHYMDDTRFYNRTEEILATIILTLGGLITLIIQSLVTQAFDKESRYYYKKGLGMVFRYNREKVEQAYKD